MTKTKSILAALALCGVLVTVLVAQNPNVPLSQSSLATQVNIANATSTGTTLFKLAKLTGAPTTAVITATTDTAGVIGVVTGSAGTSGRATIQTSGLTPTGSGCIFDGSTTAGDYVQISSMTAGDCTDGGSTVPASGQVIGRVLTTNTGGGRYQIDITGGGSGGSGGTTGPTGPTGSAGPILRKSANYAVTCTDVGNLMTFQSITNSVTFTIPNGCSTTGKVSFITGASAPAVFDLATHTVTANGSSTLTSLPAGTGTIGFPAYTLIVNPDIANDYIVNGAAVGATGPTGVTGATGATGATGVTGTTGVTNGAFGASFGSPAGSALTSGSTQTSYFTVARACTINSWNINVDAGTVTFDIWKIATGTANPTVTNSIVASAPPALSTGTAIHSTTLTSWTTSVALNDIIAINISAVATAKFASLTVGCS